MSARTLERGMQITKGVSLVEQLSSGGMGAVWLADHAGLKTRVVVKFMLGDLGSSDTARTRFSREAAAAAQVKSPHVVQMLDHGVTDDGIPFIVMEHLEGHDLGDEITKHGPLEPAKAVAVVAQVAKALAKVHAAGLLHRDIKPDNIFLVDGEEEVFAKVLDFGIAKASTAEGQEGQPLDSETKTGQIVGTPFYMSPEQVTAQKVIDHRADLWALGVVAFEALTGQRPFDGPSFGALAVKIATGVPPRPSEINAALPAPVDAWFAKACAREAANRYASAKEMSDGLRAAFEGHVTLLPTIDSSQVDVVRPPSGARQVSPTLGLAETAVDTVTGPKQAALARSEAGVSLASSPRAALSWRAFVAVAAIVVVGVAFFGLRKSPAEGAKPSADPSTTVPLAPSGPSAPLPDPSAPPPGSVAPVASTARSATIEPATARPDAGRASPAAVRPRPIAGGAGTASKPEPAAKPTPKPASSEPDLF